MRHPRPRWIGLNRRRPPARGAFRFVRSDDVLYTPDAVDAIATLVLRLFDGNANDGDGPFLLADPPGRVPKNHARFMSLMEDRLAFPALPEATVGAPS